MSTEKPHMDEAFNAIVCPQAHPLSTCSALSRPMGAIKLSDCLFPPHAQPCNLFLYLAARHVTFVSQLYFIVLFVFFCKKIRVFFTFITFLFLVSVIQ